MAEKYPEHQHDTAAAMHHRLSTAQRNYHSLGVKDAKKAQLVKSVAETLNVGENFLVIC